MVQPSDWSSTASTNTFRVFSTYNLIRKHNSSWIGVHVLKITVFSVITNSIIATGHFADASVALNSSSELQTNLSASVCGTRTHQCHVSVVVLDRPDLSCFLQSLRASCWLLARRSVLAQMLIYWLLNEARSGVTVHFISSVWFWVKSWKKINKCMCQLVCQVGTCFLKAWSSQLESAESSSSQTPAHTFLSPADHHSSSTLEKFWPSSNMKKVSSGRGSEPSAFLAGLPAVLS